MALSDVGTEMQTCPGLCKTGEGEPLNAHKCLQQTALCARSPGMVHPLPRRFQKLEFTVE